MSLGASLAGRVRVAAMTVRACLASVTRRPLRVASTPAGVAITDRRRGFYDAFILMGLMSLAMEVPVSSWILLSSVHEASTRAVVRVLLALAEVATFVALVGDRRLVAASGGHVLTPTHLVLRAGARAEARVPLEAIDSIEMLEGAKPGRWCRARGIDPRETATITLLDRPNVALRLRAGLEGGWTSMQAPRRWPRWLLVYVDDPRGLAARLG